MGAHWRNCGEDLLPASPFWSPGTTTLIGRPRHSGEDPVVGNVCDSVSRVFVVADGAPPGCSLYLPSATQTEPGSNIYFVSLFLFLSLPSLPLEKIQRAQERLSSPLQTFWSCETLLCKSIWFKRNIFLKRKHQFVFRENTDLFKVCIISKAGKFVSCILLMRAQNKLDLK